MAPSRKLAELFYEVRAKTEGLDKDLAGAQRSFGKLTDYVLKNPVQAGLALGTALAGVAVKAAKMAEEVDRSMRKVQASTSGGTEGIRKLRTEIEALSAATGRSQAELAAAAAETAKSVGSMEEIGQRLNAALTLSQASGEDLSLVLNGLDQVMDTFSISSDRAAQTVAQLYAAAKNKLPISDLFATIQAAAPALVQMGIDLDVGARAMANLTDQGLSAKQAAREFKALAELGAEGGERIRELAGDVPALSSAFEDLDRAAAAANNSTGNLIKRLGAGLAAPLIALGSTILPPVNKFLEANVTLVEILTGRYKDAADAANQFADANKGIPTGVNNPITISARGGLTAEDIKARQEAAAKAAKAAKEAAEAAAKAEKAVRDARLRAVNDALDKEVDARKKANAEIQKLQKDSAKQLAQAMGDSVRVIEIELAEMIGKLRELGASDAEIEQITAPLEAAKKAAQGLNGALEKIQLTPEQQRKLKDGLEAPKKDLEEVESAALKVAQAISDVGTAILGMASALGLVDQQTASIARGVLDIGAGGTRIAKGDVLGGGLQLLGGLGGIIGGLLGGGPDPETLRAQQELTEALDRLRDRIGDLSTFTSAGSDIAGVSSVSLTTRRIAGRDDITGEDIFEDIPRSVSDVLADLRKLGVGLDDLRQIASDASITLSDSPTIAELQNLQRVLQDIDFAAFLGTFEGQLSALQQRFELFGDAFDEPGERLAAFVDLLNDPTVGAPALFGAFEGLDAATEEGRAAIQSLIQDLFNRATLGEITLDELDGLNLEQFLAALQQLNDTVNDSADAANAAEEAVNSLAVSLAEAFSDIDLDAAIFGESLADTFNKKFTSIIAGLPAPEGTGGGTPGGAFDLSTQAGRDEARKSLQQLAISNPELKPLIADLIRDLDSLPELVGDAVGESVGAALGGRGSSTLSSSIQTLTIFQGDRLITLSESQLLVQRQIATLISGASATKSQGIQPPALSGFSGAVSASIASGTSIVFAAGSVVVQAPAGTTDAEAFGEAFVVGANRALADRVVRDRFFAGSSRVV
jgi:methyl-accepting chemotaxis protein